MLNFFGRVIERNVAYLSEKNPIISYMNSRDYRHGKAGLIFGPFCDYSYTQQFLSGLISAFNNATDAEKKAFLQQDTTRNKLFEVTNRLLSFYIGSYARDLDFSHLNSLLEMIAFDENTEREFYHSDDFIVTFIEFIRHGNAYYEDLENAPLMNKSMMEWRQAYDYCLAAIQKFPDLTTDARLNNLFNGKYYSNGGFVKRIVLLWKKTNAIPESTLFSVDHLQQLLDRTRNNSWISKIDLLYFIQKTSVYLGGALTNDMILARQNKVYMDRKVFLHAKSASLYDFTYYASVLITFLNDPDKLYDYFGNCDQVQTLMLEKIVLVEKVLREVEIASFDSSCDYLSSSPGKHYEQFVEKAKVSKEKFSIWKNQFFGEMVGNFCIPGEMTVFQHLQSSDEVNDNFQILLNLGVSPDMSLRMGYFDMRHREVSLCAKFLIQDKLVLTNRIEKRIEKIDTSITNTSSGYNIR